MSDRPLCKGRLMVLIVGVVLTWLAGSVAVISICLSSAAGDRQLERALPAPELGAADPVGLLITVLRFRTSSWTYATCRHTD